MFSRLGLGDVPKFHLEYAARYKDERRHIHKLSTVHKEFTVLSAISANTSTIARSLEEDGHSPEILLKRWGSNILEPDFRAFLEMAPLHSIYGQNSKSYTTKTFQSMKNYNIPEWIYDYGQTHVSIGCVDFAQLLLGRLNPRKEGGPLVFYGIDSSSISIARCWILYQMMKNGANSKSILQVWFSSAWSNQAQADFVAAITDLLASNLEDEELTKILKHWQTSQMDVKTTVNTWATEDDLLKAGRNAPFEACANLENEVDRVDFARYLFTGYIFVEEDSLQYRNVTMFSIPENIECRKVEEENFFHTFNFSHPEFVYEKSLMHSVERFMNKKIEYIMKEVQKTKIKMSFRIATISPETPELLKEIQTMNPYTVDWSNIMDYFSKQDFFCMARAASSEDTVHYIHLMNWVSCYKGASVFDYALEAKVNLIEHALQSHKGVHEAMMVMSPSYSKMWQNKLSYQNITNLVDFALAASIRTSYIDHIFGQEASFQINSSMANCTLRRSHTTIHGGFTFDTETNLQLLLE